MSYYKRGCEPQNERYIHVAKDDGEIYQDKETMEILSDYVILERLNEQDKEIKNLKKALWDAETRYIEEKNEFSIDFEKDMEWLKKDFEREYWND